MSEVEKTPDTEVNDEEKHQEEVVNEDATEKDATSSEHSTKAKDPKGNVLDVFKQFASSTGPSWADMMIEEAATVVSFCQFFSYLNLLLLRRQKSTNSDLIKSTKKSII